MSVACFTGHRQINNQYYNQNNPSAGWHTLKLYLNNTLMGLMSQTDHFISGLAIGVDMLAAECVAYTRTFVKTPVLLTGAAPFPAQPSKWPQQTKDHYNYVCSLCNELIAVSPDPYHPSKMQIRNEWMVNHSDYVIAIWNGVEKGGTWNCISYARSLGKPILWIGQSDIQWQSEWI